MLVRRVATLLFLFACIACSAVDRPEPPRHVLFVGNSLTYVGNLPAVYAALASANGHATRSDMIVQGGAALSERVADGSVARALAENQYTTLVLQERGGALVCAFGPQSCVESQAAIKDLARMARKHGVEVVLLGTYQSLPAMSRLLVEKEAAAAQAAGIAYVAVSENLQRLRTAAPALAWFDSDGAHPGKDLALLNAMLVYQALHGALTKTDALTVTAPIYGRSSGLTPVLRKADGVPPLSTTPPEIRYPSDTLTTLRNAIEGTRRAEN